MKGIIGTSTVLEQKKKRKCRKKSQVSWRRNYKGVRLNRNEERRICEFEDNPCEVRVSYLSPEEIKEILGGDD